MSEQSPLLINKQECKLKALHLPLLNAQLKAL